jgi:hypothetical protein
MRRIVRYDRFYGRAGRERAAIYERRCLEQSKHSAGSQSGLPCYPPRGVEAARPKGSVGACPEE